MQSGIGQITARRDKTQESARSVRSEFVSGNYFRTFGLKPQIGRLFTDADNVEGAPFVAVMSYDMWQNNYAGDPSVVGSTFWVNTKSRHHYRYRSQRLPTAIALSSTPPDFYLPIESMPSSGECSARAIPDRRWLYLHRTRKTRRRYGAAPGQNHQIGPQSFAATPIFSDAEGKRAVAKAKAVLSPAGAGIQDMQDS